VNEADKVAGFIK